MEQKAKSASFSYAAIGVGAIALLIAMVHTFAGPFAPTQSVDVTIGEIAGNMRAAALRALAGEAQPEPVAAAWDIDRMLKMLAPSAGVTGILLAIVGFVRHEPKRAVVCGLALGAGALMVQILFWITLMICGVILIFGIMQNLDSILG